ncbi:MAG: TRAP transporter substrate-binding protein DctP [Thermodesulfobacteriota bacterium]|nr:TRAP transporter substrate-binding protein DctP [Thermodesulfobacteriota bacterium]
MRLKRIFLLSLILVVFFLYFFNLEYVYSKEPKAVLKFATLAPDGVGWAIYAKEYLIEAIEKATNYNVKLDPYFGGVMGDDEDYISKMRINQLQGAGLSASGIVMACPEIAVLELPFLFENFDEVDYIRKKMRDRLSHLYEKNGYKLWMLLDQDFDKIFSTKNEIRSLKDFNKSRFVTWVGHVEYETLKSLNTSPIPLNVPEIPSSIRSKIVNAMMAPPIWYVGTQLYTVTKYITDCKMRYSPGGVVVTMNAWNSITEKNKKQIMEVVQRCESVLNDYGHDSNEKCLCAMVKYGLKEVKLTPGEIEILKKNTRPVWDNLVGKVYSRDLLNKIVRYLEEYRSAVKAR